ncbi:MAG: hypothetical protein VX371_03600, partial [Verrucomicrobiota bacterium]|nr:hypothetical protein [Verrucomicrobiota bacterium]
QLLFLESLSRLAHNFSRKRREGGVLGFSTLQLWNKRGFPYFRYSASYEMPFWVFVELREIIFIDSLPRSA